MGLIKITNRYLNEVNWAPAASSDFKAPDTAVDVYRISVSFNLPFYDSCNGILSPDEIARAKRFYRRADQNRYVISHGAIRAILCKYLGLPPAKLIFGERTNKKPFLISPGTSNLCYNISHSGDWVLMTVGRFESGADTEFINQEFDFNDIIHQNFSTDEVAYINSADLSERFFMLWTRKEALIKATGIGLMENLKLLPALDGVYTCSGEILQTASDWLVSSFKVAEDYRGSVAHSPAAFGIRFFDYNFHNWPGLW
jgi:4'-phosphopantetheinyl transferase